MRVLFENRYLRGAGLLFLFIWSQQLFAQPTRLFMVAGQSNCRGTGDSLLSPLPLPGTAFEYSQSQNALIPLADPVGEYFGFFQEAVYGSAWPAFGDKYHQLTGENVVLVSCAKGGSGITPGSGGAWSVGPLESRAILKGKDAEMATGLPLSGIVWVQGEEDAAAMYFGNSTALEYEKDLDTLIATFRSEFSCNLPFYIVKTGLNGALPKASFQAIAQAQQNVADRDPNTYIVHDSAAIFYGLGWMVDKVHYDQNGLNHLGWEAARNVATIEEQRRASTRLDTSGTLLICPDDSILLGGPPGFAQYNWSDGSTGQFIWAKNQANYSLWLTDTLGCDSIPGSNITSLVHRPRPTRPSVGYASLTACPGDSFELIGPAGYPAYEWSDGNTFSRDTVDTIGAYFFRVTDSLGCLSEWSDTVQTTHFPVPPAPIFTPVEDTTLCFGDSLQAGFSLNLPVHIWSDGFVGGQRSLTQSGSYLAYAIDSNGCESPWSDSLKLDFYAPVPAPVLSVSGPPAICEGDSLFISGPSGFNQYQWNTGEITRQIRVDTGGSFFLNAAIDSFGCQSPPSAPVSVILWQNPAKPSVAVLSGDTTFCFGDSVTLGAPGGFSSYLWQDGLSSADRTISSPGSFVVQVEDSNGCRSPWSDTVQTTRLPLPLAPVFTPVEDTTLCFGDSLQAGFSLNLPVHIWSDGFVGGQRSLTQSGSYLAYAIDSNGCESPWSDSLKLDFYAPVPAPVLSLSGPPAICEGDSLFISGPSGFNQYQWNTGEITSQIRVDTGGTFFLNAAIDSFGCQSPPSAPVSVILWQNPAKPSVTVLSGDTTFCFGDSVTLGAPGGFSSFLWQDGLSSADRTINSPGSFVVQVEDSNGCRSPWSDTTKTQVLALPAPPSLSPGKDSSICTGGSLVLSAAGGPYPQYDWSTGAGTPQISVSAAGSYTLRITDLNGCQSLPSQPFNLSLNPLPPPPQLTPSGPVDLCIGDSISFFGPTGYTNYYWSDGSGLPSLEVKTNGSWSLVVEDSLGCLSSASAAAQVILRPLPPAPLVQNLGDSVLCQGERTILAAPGGYAAYHWSDGTTTFRDTVSVAGTYQVQVETVYGCIGPWSDSVTVQVNPLPPQAQASFVGNSQACQGDTLWVVAQPSGYPVYNWFSGQFGETVPITSPGQVSVFIQDTNGCNGLPSNILNPTFLPSPATPAIILNGNGDLEATPAQGTFTWLLNGVPVPGQTGSVLSFPQPGTYTVVSQLNGCFSDTSAAFVLVNRTEPLTQADVSIYPNPVRDKVWLEFAGTNGKEISWQVLSPEGRSIARGKSRKPSFAIETDEWGANGMYLLKLECGERRIYRKVVLFQ